MKRPTEFMREVDVLDSAVAGVVGTAHQKLLAAPSRVFNGVEPDAEVSDQYPGNIAEGDRALMEERPERVSSDCPKCLFLIDELQQATNNYVDAVSLLNDLALERNFSSLYSALSRAEALRKHLHDVSNRLRAHSSNCKDRLTSSE